MKGTHLGKREASERILPSEMDADREGERFGALQSEDCWWKFADGRNRIISSQKVG